MSATPLPIHSRRTSDLMLEQLRTEFLAHQESCDRKTELLIAMVQAEADRAAAWREATTADIGDINAQLARAWPQIDAATKLRLQIRHAVAGITLLGTAVAFLWELVGSHLVWK